ncbi:hypothetical protein BOTBODRAFT_60887 [Botryobasidium botryosum FD-172 SS1]|uniref:Uncharacterized protein n=1 Tax=Botryobasidium botryosum (strain FD-172 SS1) TaxID=930990 RepID=A0A067M163_BOTB1|nr:hypothetical protein BOTBODRAFT_60887 [Botryobasidium botryosum FD-172 SS1]
MTTGRINQVTIVSYTPAHTGHRVVATGAPGGPFAAGRFCHEAFSSFWVRLLPGKAGPEANRSDGSKPPQISPGPTNFRGTLCLPLARETPPPQGEDCQKTSSARGAARSRRISKWFYIAFRFDPSASNPHPSSQRDTRHKRTMPDKNQAPDRFAQGITPHGTNPPGRGQATPHNTYLHQEDTGKHLFSPSQASNSSTPQVQRSRRVNGSIQGWPAVPPRARRGNRHTNVTATTIDESPYGGV